MLPGRSICREASTRFLTSHSSVLVCDGARLQICATQIRLGIRRSFSSKIVISVLFLKAKRAAFTSITRRIPITEKYILDPCNKKIRRTINRRSRPASAPQTRTNNAPAAPTVGLHVLQRKTTHMNLLRWLLLVMTLYVGGYFAIIAPSAPRSARSG